MGFKISAFTESLTLSLTDIFHLRTTGGIDKKITADNLIKYFASFLRPIGSTYIQFPGDDSPSTLGFRGTWSNVSSDIAGDYIRFEGTAGNGVTAKTFDTGEELDAGQRLTGEAGGQRVNSPFGVSGVHFDNGNSAVLTGAGGTIKGVSFDSNGGTSPNAAKTNDVETRVVYQTVRKWKRTA